MAEAELANRTRFCARVPPIVRAGWFARDAT